MFHLPQSVFPHVYSSPFLMKPTCVWPQPIGNSRYANFCRIIGILSAWMDLKDLILNSYFQDGWVQIEVHVYT